MNKFLLIIMLYVIGWWGNYIYIRGKKMGNNEKWGRMLEVYIEGFIWFIVENFFNDYVGNGVMRWWKIDII